MTPTDRAAMEQAKAALEEAQRLNRDVPNSLNETGCQIANAISSLTTALATPDAAGTMKAAEEWAFLIDARGDQEYLTHWIKRIQADALSAAPQAAMQQARDAALEETIASLTTAGTMKAAEDGLLPCPFCGEPPQFGEQHISDQTGENYGYAFCQCTKSTEHFAGFHCDTVEEAKSRWNTRALIGTPQAPQDVGRVWNDDMSQAPKDGTHILLWAYKRQQQEYCACEASWHQPANPSMSGFWLGDFDHKRARSPTHWMPLPAAPQPGAGEKGE